MDLDVISYHSLLAPEKNNDAIKKAEQALLQKGIIGVKDVPDFEQKTRHYIQATRKFTALSETTKQHYAPNRDIGDTEGYELGAEWFQDADGQWHIDDKKASFYAFVPNHARNKWPQEVDLKTSYLELGELIFKTGKHLLNILGLNQTVGLDHDSLVGYGRMLHYKKETASNHINENWCGAHVDHGVFTGLIPAYYFQAGEEVEEPEEAGLYIFPTHGKEFEKIHANDKSILLFQVGEFGQLASNDRICATRHLVKKAQNDIERFTFALFYSAAHDAMIHPTSTLTTDSRYQAHEANHGSISYGAWEKASFERYRAK